MEAVAKASMVAGITSASMSMPAFPLSFLKPGDSARVIKLKAKGDLHHHMENLGFVEGSRVTVVSDNGGNLIVEVKGAQFGLDKNMARKIVVG